jgi:hypothetical protein
VIFDTDSANDLLVKTAESAWLENHFRMGHYPINRERAQEMGHIDGEGNPSPSNPHYINGISLLYCRCGTIYHYDPERDLTIRGGRNRFIAEHIGIGHGLINREEAIRLGIVADPRQIAQAGTDGTDMDDPSG